MNYFMHHRNAATSLGRKWEWHCRAQHYDAVSLNRQRRML